MATCSNKKPGEEYVLHNGKYPMRRMFLSVYFWFGLVFILYSIFRSLLELSARLPNDISSTVVSLALFLLGVALIVIAYRQIR
jgi:prolipoprotein diacylglyceryltransferase